LVYLDNAATTPVSATAISAMTEVLEDIYGNPSSSHSTGRKAKILVESTRKLIAQKLNCQPGEIFFTAGGSEADNMAILNSVRDLGIRRIITSPIEHHAVLHPIKFLEDQSGVEVNYVKVNKGGEIDLEDLSQLLDNEKLTLVSLMYANNEIGNLLPIQEVAEMCIEKKAFFHSDMVQAFGHYPIDLAQLPIHFLASSAHKYHGPKGVGFCFIRGGIGVKPLLHGGGQERNLRAGTENVHSIAGMQAAIEEAYSNLESDRAHIESLKKHLIQKIESYPFPIGFNGLSFDLERSLYTVLNLSLPKNPNTEMILFQLDMEGFAVSGGSACNSGAVKGSHVIDVLRGENEQVALRVSFSKNNTIQEVDEFAEALFAILSKDAA